MSFSKCVGVLALDPQEAQEMRDVINNARNEADGVSQYLYEMLANLEDMRAQLRDQGYDVDAPAREFNQGSDNQFDLENEGFKTAVVDKTLIVYESYPSEKKVEIHIVQTADGFRRQGRARNAMEIFLAEADRLDYASFLVPSPFVTKKAPTGEIRTDIDPDLTTDQVKKFYGSLGFVDNQGSRLDPRSDFDMVRQPGAVSSPLINVNDPYNFSQGGFKTVKEGPVSISYISAPDRQFVELTRIYTDNDARNEGYATEMMERFLQNADDLGFAVFLTPHNLDQETRLPRLRAFYKKFGFVNNVAGDNDSRSKSAYVRQPRGVTLGQTGGRRASVRIPEGGVFSTEDVVVELAEKSDVTSFLHEFAHITLEMLQSMEGQSPFVDEQLSKIRAILGVDPSQTEMTREQHEKFADLFESYLKSGRTVNAELKPVMREIRRWFTDVYAGAKEALPKLNKEARELFDALLASQEDVDIAYKKVGVTSSKYIRELLPPSERAEYDTITSQASVIAQERYFKSVISEIQDRNSPTYKQRVNKIKKRVEKEVSEEPVYKAILDLTTDGTQRLNYKDVEDLLPTGLAAIKIPKGNKNRTVYTRQNDGVHPDMVAVKHGFTSGVEMVRAMATADSIKKRVDVLTADEVNRQGGAEQELGEAAIKSVFNSATIRVMGMARDAIAQKTVTRPLRVAQIKNEAENYINDTRPAAIVIRPSQYAIKSNSLYKKSIRNAAKGEYESALKFVHQAMYHHELARLSYRAKVDKKKYDNKVTKIGSRKYDPKRYDARFIQAIKNFGSIVNETASRIEAAKIEAANFATEQGLILPSALNSDDNVSASEMTLSELKEAYDYVKQLEHMGREIKKNDDEAFRLESQELAESIFEKAPQRKPTAREKTVWQKVTFPLDSLEAQMNRLPFMLEHLDGFAKDGPATMTFDRPLREASANVLQRNDEDAQALRDILERHDITNKELNRRVKEPSIDPVGDGSVFFERIFALALNMGNEGNVSRLNNDPTTSLTTKEDHMRVIGAHFEQRHWDAVQEIWNLIDSKWPEIRSLEIRTKGVAPERVKPVEVVTPFGVYRGGYYPIKYDPARAENRNIARTQEQDSFDSLLHGGAGRSQTKQGFAKERLSNVSRPVLLSLNAVLTHLQEVNTDLELRLPINDVWRRFNAPEVRDAIVNSRGLEAYKAMETMIKRVVTGVEAPTDAMSKLVRSLRVNAAVSLLALSFRTVILQPLSLVQTVAPRYGGLTPIRMLANFYSGGLGQASQNMNEVIEKSAFMRERVSTATRELYDMVKTGQLFQPYRRFQAMAFQPMIQVEMWSVSAPLWFHIYQAELLNGKHESEAISFADKAVATTQGSGLPIDQSVLQGGNEITRALTFMWGYMSGVFGITRNAISHARQTKRILPLLSTLTLIYLIPSLFEALLVAGGDDFEEDSYFKSVGERVAGTTLGTIPLVGVATNKYLFGGSMFSIDSTMDDAANTFQSWEAIAETLFLEGYIEGEDLDRALISTIRGGGTLFGVPGTSQMVRTTKALLQDDDPTLWEIVVTGPDRDN